MAQLRELKSALNKPKRKEIDPQRDGQKTRKFDQLLINKPYSFIQKRRQTKKTNE